MNYEIICSKCKASRPVKIIPSPIGRRVDWLESEDNANHPIMSARERLDGEMGFQCRCGNNDLMTKQEKNVMSNLVTPKPKEIEEIVRNLIPDKPKFELRTI